MHDGGLGCCETDSKRKRILPPVVGMGIDVDGALAGDPELLGDEIAPVWQVLDRC